MKGSMFVMGIGWIIWLIHTVTAQGFPVCDNDTDGLGDCKACNSISDCEQKYSNNEMGPACTDAINEVCHTSTFASHAEEFMKSMINQNYQCADADHDNIMHDFCIDCTGRNLTNLPCILNETKYLLLANNSDLTTIDFAGSWAEDGLSLAVLDLSYTGIDSLPNDLRSNGTGSFFNIAVFNLKLNGLRFDTPLASYAFSGIATILNDFQMKHCTFKANISEFAFAALTIGRDMWLSNAIFENGATFERYAFRTLLVGRNFMLDGLSMDSLHEYSFDGLVVYKDFNMENSTIRSPRNSEVSDPSSGIQPYAFYFLMAGAFIMDGSRVANNKLRVNTFNGMILTYVKNQAVNLDTGTYLSAQYCNLTTLEIQGSNGPFDEMTLNFESMSKLKLGYNELSKISSDIFDTVTFQTLELQYNNIEIYEAGWASTLLLVNGSVETYGNPSSCTIIYGGGDSSSESFVLNNVSVPGYMTLSQLNQGFQVVDGQLYCTCKSGPKNLTGTGILQRTNGTLQKTKTFCDNIPCPVKELGKLNYLVNNSHGKYGNPVNSQKEFANLEELQFQCDEGYEPESLPLLQSDFAQCRGGLLSIPQPLPTCSKIPLQAASHTWVLYVVCVILLINGWIMKNFLLFEPHQSRDWELEICAGNTVNLPTSQNCYDALWPVGTFKSTSRNPTRLRKIRRVLYETIVSIVVIVPFFGVFFATRKLKGQKEEINKRLLDEQDYREQLSIELKHEKKIWEIDLQHVDFSFYHAAAPLGAGNFGTVRKARWLGADVAVKELSYRNAYVSHTDSINDFLKEGEVMKALQHPNIVHFYGIGHKFNNELQISEHFLVQELMHGTLSDYLYGKDGHEPTPDSQFTWDIRYRFISEISSAMTFLHSRDPPMIHRDLKPANCLLDANLRVKVADFGTVKWKLFTRHREQQRSRSKNKWIKKQQEANISTDNSTDSPVGTPLYMAPECFGNNHLKAGLKVDVWAFGFMLFEICTRQVPFHNVSFFLTKIDDGKRPTDYMKPGTDLGSVPKAFQQLMKECWDTNPAKRPPFQDKHNRNISTIIEAAATQLPKPIKYTYT